jgi:hypothetical protein
MKSYQMSMISSHIKPIMKLMCKTYELCKSIYRKCENLGNILEHKGLISDGQKYNQAQQGLALL